MSLVEPPSVKKTLTQKLRGLADSVPFKARCIRYSPEVRHWLGATLQTRTIMAIDYNGVWQVPTADEIRAYYMYESKFQEWTRYVERRRLSVRKRHVGDDEDGDEQTVKPPPTKPDMLERYLQWVPTRSRVYISSVRWSQGGFVVNTNSFSIASSSLGETNITCFWRVDGSLNGNLALVKNTGPLKQLPDDTDPSRAPWSKLNFDRINVRTTNIALQ